MSEPERVADISERIMETFNRLGLEERERRAEAFDAEQRRLEESNATDRIYRLVPARFRGAEITEPGVREWWEDRDQKQGLLLSGPTGTGKTHQAWAIGIECIRTTDYDPTFRSVPMLLAELSPGNDHARVVKRYAQAPFLILDDLGTERDTPYAAEQVHLIIDSRYAEMKPTVLTTNVPGRKFSEHFGERLSSRLHEMCKVVAVKGPDRRRS